MKLEILAIDYCSIKTDSNRTNNHACALCEYFFRLGAQYFSIIISNKFMC